MLVAAAAVVSVGVMVVVGEFNSVAVAAVSGMEGSRLGAVVAESAAFCLTVVAVTGVDTWINRQTQ